MAIETGTKTVYQKGDRPGAGTYLCMNCKSFTIRVRRDEQLPACKSCKDDKPARFERVGD